MCRLHTYNMCETYVLNVFYTLLQVYYICNIPNTTHVLHIIYESHMKQYS